MANTNPLSIRSILEREKPSKTNFLERYRKLRMVLKDKNKEYVIKHYPSVMPASDAAKEVIDDCQKHLMDSHDITSLILETMTPDLVKELGHLAAIDMIKTLMRRNSQEVRQERYEVLNLFLNKKPGKEDMVVTHVRKMVDYINYLGELGMAISQHMALDVILLSWPENYGRYLATLSKSELLKKQPELFLVIEATSVPQNAPISTKPAVSTKG